MADSGQNYGNHTRFFPPFHFVAAPITMLYFLNEVRHVWMNPNRSTAFAALVAFGILAGVFASRLMALKVQDRVIRLELQMRMRGLLPSDLHGRIHELTPPQMVALRFAGDGELENLVREVLAGKLSSQKAIKMAIRDWKGDYLRA
ncbi:MAG: DUF6526 family protein [Vicinamibacterales bacterium]